MGLLKNGIILLQNGMESLKNGMGLLINLIYLITVLVQGGPPTLLYVNLVAIGANKLHEIEKNP
jgi:hypothetical protein